MLNLQPVTQLDYGRIRIWAQMPEMRDYFRRLPPLPIWDTDKALESLCTTSWVILNDSICVGMISLGYFDQQSRKVEIALLMEKVENRKALYFEAVRQICDYVFNYLGYNKVYFPLLTTRKEFSKSVHEFGFRLEGYLRDNIYFEGAYHDEFIFGLTRRDYLKGE